MTKQLCVIISGVFAGHLTQGTSGELSFSYNRDYEGVPLSLSMPVSNRVYQDNAVSPYLFGLLPDSLEVRRKLGREFGVSGNNPFDLLSNIGLDCPGAVQICSTDGLQDALKQAGTLVPISEKAIASRLAQIRQRGEESWEAPRERWSLGGQQAKFALRRNEKGWFKCEGATATTHILKPGISNLRYSALNEYACLALANACGVPAARAEYRLFNDEAAIVVTRFDRAKNKRGDIVRLHQEDFCQILGVLPDNKYPEDGGPAANDVISVLKRTGSSTADNIRQFLAILFFNYLIAAPDAHAKNYSLLLDVHDAYLAPLYDVATALPYSSRPFNVKLAMGIAGENRVGHISASRLRRFHKANQLDDLGIQSDELIEMLAGLAQAIPSKFEDVAENNSGVPDMDIFVDKTLAPLRQLCERSLARLEHDISSG